MKTKIDSANNGNVIMEAGDHLKNGASSKSLMSRGNMLKTANIMKKIICFFIAGIALCMSVSAQPELIYKGGVLQNGTKLTAEQVREVMSGNSEALELYNSGRSIFVTGQVISYPCAFLLGWDLGTRLGGGKGNGTLLTVGAVGTVVGLIIGLSGESKIKESVSLYNSKASNNALSYRVNFGFTQTGVGLSMRF